MEFLSKKGTAARYALISFLNSPYPGELDRLEVINHALRTRVISTKEFKELTPPVSLQARQTFERGRIQANNVILKWFEERRADRRAREAYDTELRQYNDMQLLSAWIDKLASRKAWFRADGPTFEKLVAHHFSKIGYDVWNRGGKNDHGVDLVIEKDGVRSIVQCKAHREFVGPAIVRELYGTMLAEGANNAILATMRGVTHSAREWIAGKPISVMALDDFV